MNDNDKLTLQTLQRQSVDEYLLSIAEMTATRSTCKHRHQGAVLTTSNHRIISTGYNGSAPGQPHCDELDDCMKISTDGVFCRADGLHGESNAIITAARLGIPTDNTTMYSVYSPCRMCCHIMAVAGVTKVIYREVYSSYPEGPSLLDKLGIENYMLPKAKEDSNAKN